MMPSTLLVSVMFLRRRRAEHSCERQGGKGTLVEGMGTPTGRRRPPPPCRFARKQGRGVPSLAKTWAGARGGASNLSLILALVRFEVGTSHGIQKSYKLIGSLAVGRPGPKGPPYGKCYSRSTEG